MSEVKQFRLPDVGEGLTEADIVKWHVQPGDPVKINQIIVEIETAKAVVELPSPFEGVVADLLAAEGTTVEVGTPIVSVTTGGDGGAAAAAGGTGGAGVAAGGGAGVAAGGRAGPATAGAEREAEATAPAASPGAESQADAAALPAAEAVAGTQESASGAAAPAAGAAAASGEAAAGAGGAAAGTEAPTAGTEAPTAGTEAPTARTGGEAAASGGAERHAVLVGYGVKLGRTTRRPRKQPAGTSASQATLATTASQATQATQAASVPAAQPANGATAMPGDGAAAGTHVLAKPPVRKLAKDLGVDLAALAGSGPQGSITRDDVQHAATAPVPLAASEAGGLAAEAPARTTGQPREERVPIRGVRKHTAAAVSASAFTAPHVTEFLQLDVTGTMEALARIRELPEFDGVRVSPLLLAARALIVAIGRHPMINSSWDEAAQEIVVHHYVNLGIAAATGRGLVVPNIKDAHALSLAGLARALGQLTETARAGKTPPADLAHGTITITNVGVFGVDTGTPILTPGEAAILALGQIKDAPWVHEGQLAVRKVTTLALSFDHRIVDGDLGSMVLSEVGAMLADPLRMLAWG